MAASRWVVLVGVGAVRAMEQRIERLQEDLERLHPEVQLDSHHPGMQRALELARQVAGSEALVLLRGPSGTGKSTRAIAVARQNKIYFMIDDGLLVNGSPCEAPLVYGAGHGGQVVAVTGGPSFEVVHDAAEGCYTFYAVDETIDGKTYTVENPTVVVGGRTYNLTRVENEPRAWRVIGIDTAGSDARDGQLNFTLLGKTLSTRVGLSGLGAGVK